MIRNVLIIEDEPQAAQRLQTLIEGLIPDVQILAKIDSIKKAVKWITENPEPDLIFMDIQLADGLSFQIFDQVEVKSPVIFTTAFDEFALKAFKVNSIDYILKPVDKDQVAASLRKLQSLSGNRGNSADLLENINQAVKMLSKKHKTRFVIKVGEHLKFIEVADILFCYSLEKVTFAKLRDGRKHILDFTLDQLGEMLDPHQFFRINRKYVVAVNSIQDMVSYTNSRLKVVLKTCEDNDVIVARERVQEFKDWLDR